MTLEVEAKYRLPAEAESRLRSKLPELGATNTGVVTQTDLYLAHPCRDFRQTDEAFRIRTIGEQSRVTYKGPKLDTATKTRKEIELPLVDRQGYRDELLEMLVALGFMPVRDVTKERQSFALTWSEREFEVTIDHLPALGTFCEIETAAEESGLDVARDALLSLAAELSLTEPERRGYLDLLIEKEGLPGRS